MMKYSDRPNTYINAKDLEIAIIKATSYGDALDAVREAPSLEIVRCGECKHWKSTVQMPNGTEVKCLYGRKADDFCSYGEREGE